MKRNLLTAAKRISRIYSDAEVIIEGRACEIKLYHCKAVKETIDVPPQKGNMRTAPGWDIRVQLALASRTKKGHEAPET